MKSLFKLGCLLVLLTAACHESREFGAACTSDRQCASRLCVAINEAADEGRCTKSCATDEDCPEGFSCRGATNQGVVICLPGPAVPIGGMGQ